MKSSRPVALSRQDATEDQVPKPRLNKVWRYSWSGQTEPSDQTDDSDRVAFLSGHICLKKHFLLQKEHVLSVYVATHRGIGLEGIMRESFTSPVQLIRYLFITFCIICIYKYLLAVKPNLP